MAIKIKSRIPKTTDFQPDDIIINTKTGDIFYKNKKDLFKIKGDKIDTPNINENINEISGSLSISGSIITNGSGSHDLGSETRPWKDIHVMSSSIKFYDNSGEVGRVSFVKDQGLRVTDEQDSIESLIVNINGGSFYFTYMYI